MRVVMVEVGRNACEMELEDSLASMQHAVGGLIQAVYEPGGRNAALICNEEGKLLGLPLNRALRDTTSLWACSSSAGHRQTARTSHLLRTSRLPIGSDVLPSRNSSSTSMVRSSTYRWRNRANRVYPNGTQKKSPNRVTSRILARAICGKDSIGTTLLFGGNDLFAICL